MKTLQLAGTTRTLRLVRDFSTVTGFSVDVAPPPSSAPVTGSLSWESCFEQLQAKDQLFRIAMRRAAAAALVARGAEEVGSSDVNHAIFAAFRRSRGDLGETLADLMSEL